MYFYKYVLGFYVIFGLWFISLFFVNYFNYAFVTGLGPDYIIPGPWPELTPLALRFRQEPPFITINNGVRPS